jgi:hypothetical protein
MRRTPKHAPLPRLVRESHESAQRRSEGVRAAEFTSRLAVAADVPALTVLMEAAIFELQRTFLDDAIASSRAIMGIDTQLIRETESNVGEFPARRRPDARQPPRC